LRVLLPPLAAHPNSKAVTYIPEVVLMIFYIGFLLTSDGQRRGARLGPKWWLLLLIGLHAMLQLNAYGGHGSMGSIVVVIMTVIFLQFLNLHCAVTCVSTLRLRELRKWRSGQMAAAPYTSTANASNIL